MKEINFFVNDEEKGGFRGDGKGYFIGLWLIDCYIVWRMVYDIRWI